MSKMIDYLKAAGGEASLLTRLGFWRQAVSLTVDQLVVLVEQISGGGLLPATGTTQGSRPLSGYNTALLQTGDEVFVQGINEPYYYDASSALAADQLNVVNAVGPGQFIRLSSVIVQADWYVDSVAGDDQNDGTVGAPIKTLAELFRRTQGRTWLLDTTIRLSGDFSTQQLVLTGEILPGKTIIVRGDVSQVLSGSISAFTAWNAGTSTIGLFNDGTGATDYATHIGKFLRITSGGASGSSSPVLKSIAAGQCRPGVFILEDGTKVTPGVGASFVLEDYTTKIGGVDLTGLSGNGGDKAAFVPRISIRELEIRQPPQDLSFGSGNYIGTYLYRVRFAGTGLCYVGQGIVSLNGTYNSQQMAFLNADVYFFGHAAAGAITMLASRSFSSTDLIHQGAGFFLTQGATATSTGPQGFFDVAGFCCLSVAQNARYAASAAGGILWGSGNTATYGIYVGTGCTVQYVTKPTVTGVSDAYVGGTARTYAQIPYAETNVALGYGAAIVPSV